MQLVRRDTLLLMVTCAFAQPAMVEAQSLNRAQRLFDAGEVGAAKQELIALQQNDSTKPGVPYYLGRIALMEQRNGDAVAMFETAVRLNETSAAYHAWLGVSLKKQAFASGALKRIGLIKRMKKEMERAIALDASQVEAHIALAQYYHMAPGIMGGSKEIARTHARHIMQFDAFQGTLTEGTIAGWENDTTKAAAAFRNAFALIPDSIGAYAELAEAYIDIGNSQSAFAVLSAYSQKHPNDKWFFYHFGRAAALSSARLVAGDEALAQFLNDPPAMATTFWRARACYWRGQIAEKRGDKSKARVQYFAALSLDPAMELARKGLRKVN